MAQPSRRGGKRGIVPGFLDAWNYPQATGTAPDCAVIWQRDVDRVLALDDMVGGEDNGSGVGAPDDARGRLAGPCGDGDNRTRRVLDDAGQLLGKLTQC